MIHPSARIHPTAVIEENVTLGANVIVGAFSFIGAEAVIGDGTHIHSHVVIKGPTTIGKYNEIFQFASVGEACQDLKYAGEPTKLIIGDHNTIREHVTLHRGTVQDKGETRIGSHNLFMINAHVAHDCEVEDHCIFANNATLAGHVKVGSHAIIGGMSAVHQFCTIGAHVMLGGGSIVVQDVPPFVMAQGNHCTPFGVNVEGLRRRGFDKSVIKAIREAYKILYRNEMVLSDAQLQIEAMAKEFPQLNVLVEFFAKSTRGIIR